VFAGITGDTEAGQRPRAQIHERLEGHDDVPVHPHVGDWEDDDSHEWKQYLLPTGSEPFADDARPLDVNPDVVGDPDGSDPGYDATPDSSHVGEMGDDEATRTDDPRMDAATTEGERR
jgi:hypothetical protein